MRNTTPRLRVMMPRSSKEAALWSCSMMGSPSSAGLIFEFQEGVFYVVLSHGVISLLIFLPAARHCRRLRVPLEFPKRPVHENQGCPSCGFRAFPNREFPGRFSLRRVALRLWRLVSFSWSCDSLFFRMTSSYLSAFSCCQWVLSGTLFDWLPSARSCCA